MKAQIRIAVTISTKKKISFAHRPGFGFPVGWGIFSYTLI
jgi:hypothetical protein